jgi:long-chain-fatty-acid---luciferin-component ligase
MATLRVRAVGVLDDLLYQTEDAFCFDEHQLLQVRAATIRGAYAHHLAGCPDYARFAATAKLHPEDLTDLAAIDRIPLVPTSVFKRRRLVTEPIAGEVRECVSSGTQGGRSTVLRDRVTLERFVGSVDQGSRLLDIDSAEDAQLYVLGPDTAEAADLWFSYVLSIVDLLHPTSFHVRGGVFELADLLEDLTHVPDGVRPVVLGPPVLVRELAEAALDKGGIDLGTGRGMVITAGGWKRFSGASISRDELTDLAVSAFRLNGPEDVRDCFNMVELNSVLFECAHRVKHVPPWMRITARDPANLSVLPSGETGILAFVDALPTSYPGFILSDDLGVVRYDLACPCGRRSDTFEISRRIQTVEARGCALKMDGAVQR